MMWTISGLQPEISRVSIFFNWNANLDVGLVDVVQRVNRILNQLPTGISPPVVLRFDITSLPVCTITVGGDMDERDLYDLAFNVVEPQIEHISGWLRPLSPEAASVEFMLPSTATGCKPSACLSSRC